LKSISVSWSSEVQDDEAVQSLAAIVGVITSLYYSRWPWGLISPIIGLRPFGNWVIPALEEGSDYSSFDWYVETATDPASDGVDAERFLELVEQEPWQQDSRHYDFSVVSGPLRLEGMPEAVPLACRPGIATVISTDWVREYDSPEAQRLALRRLSMFGIGRAMGLEPHTGDSPVCAMRSFHGRTDLLAKALEEHSHSVVYCDEHLSALLSTLLSGRAPLN
jgi:hypothetical protein